MTRGTRYSFAASQVLVCQQACVDSDGFTNLGIKLPLMWTTFSKAKLSPKEVQVIQLKRLAITCIVTGLFGAAIFYSPYIGLNWQTKFACPLCPHVSIVGDSPTGHFIRLAIGGGILNAAFLFFLALLLWGARVLVKRRLFDRPRG
jgi:hypothetical protein